MKKQFLGLYEKSMPNHLTVEEKLEMTRSAGFDYLELSIDETNEKIARLEWSKEEKQALVNATYRAGTPVFTLCLSAHRKYPLGSENVEIRQKGLDIMAKAVDLAADIGIRIIQLAGYDVYYEPSSEKTKEYFVENLRKCVDNAARKGIILAFETMETQFMDTAEKAMYYVRLVNSPYLQVYPDTGNMTNAALRYGTDAVEDLVKAKGHISALHLKETQPAVYREVPFGKGHVDFKGLIQTAHRLGVKMFTAEFWYTGSESWQQELVRTRRYFEQIMQKLD